MTTVNALAAQSAGGPLEPFTYELGELGAHDVDIAVESCGICHSDLSMLDNDWGMSQYPFVPGHEIIGSVKAVGAHVSNLKPGDRVGVGWHSGYCMDCTKLRMSGDHNLCASRSRCHRRASRRIRRHRPRSGRQPPSSSRPNSTPRPPARCSAAGSPFSTPSSSTTCRPPQMSASSASVGSGTWRSSSPAPGAATSPPLHRANPKSPRPKQWARTTRSIRAAPRSSKRTPAGSI